MLYLNLLHITTLIQTHFFQNHKEHRLRDSLVVECWLRVREVPGLIPRQGPRHTEDVIKMVPVVPLFGTQHQKGNTGSFSGIKIGK